MERLAEFTTIAFREKLRGWNGTIVVLLERKLARLCAACHPCGTVSIHFRHVIITIGWNT